VGGGRARGDYLLFERRLGIVHKTCTNVVAVTVNRVLCSDTIGIVEQVTDSKAESENGGSGDYVVSENGGCIVGGGG
jgi:hypothetical protein